MEKAKEVVKQYSWEPNHVCIIPKKKKKRLSLQLVPRNKTKDKHSHLDYHCPLLGVD